MHELSYAIEVIRKKAQAKIFALALDLSNAMPASKNCHKIWSQRAEKPSDQ